MSSKHLIDTLTLFIGITVMKEKTNELCYFCTKEIMVDFALVLLTDILATIVIKTKDAIYNSIS
jgi:uncharacterized membrane protein SirB2